MAVQTVKLNDIIMALPKSKIKAGDGINTGKYKFFTCSPIQSKYYDSFTYEGESLIMGTGGNANIHYCNEKFATSTDCLVFQKKGNLDINLKCVYYLLYGNIDLLQRGFKGCGLQHISKDYILNIEINLPERNVQDKIVDIFDHYNKVKQLKLDELTAYDNLVKSQFIEMFGDCKENPKNWETTTLNDIAYVGSSKRVFVEDLVEKGIPFYRGTEVGLLAEGKEITPNLFITQEHYEELCNASGKPEIGDLLMPSICPDGRIWLVNTKDPFYFKDGRVLWVHSIDKNYNPIFLLYTLKDRIVSDYSSIASGTTFAELKIFSLKSCSIFVVPLPLQNEFAHFVEQTDKSKFRIKQSLEKLETCYKALLQRYFG